MEATPDAAQSARRHEDATEALARPGRGKAAARDDAVAARRDEATERKDAHRASREAASREAFERPAEAQDDERRGDVGAAAFASTGALVCAACPVMGTCKIKHVLRWCALAITPVHVRYLSTMSRERCSSSRSWCRKVAPAVSSGPIMCRTQEAHKMCDKLARQWA